MSIPPLGSPTPPEMMGVLEKTTVVSIIILMILGLYLNTLILYMFLKNKHYRLPSRLQLFTLALDDLGTALLVEPIVISMFYHGDNFDASPILCRLFSNLLHIFPWGSIISLMILSFTRVIIVLFPLAHKIWITRQRVVYVIVVKYVFIAVFLIISNPLWRIFYQPQLQSCFVSYLNRPNQEIYNTVYCALIG